MEQKPEIVKILIGKDKLPEYKLDKWFTELFKTMCEAGFPVWGFMTDELGQWMFGPIECFHAVFGKDHAIIKFDVEEFVRNADHTFWWAELAENPMESKLLKYYR